MFYVLIGTFITISAADLTDWCNLKRCLVSGIEDGMGFHNNVQDTGSSRSRWGNMVLASSQMDIVVQIVVTSAWVLKLIIFFVFWNSFCYSNLPLDLNWCVNGFLLCAVFQFLKGTIISKPPLRFLTISLSTVEVSKITSFSLVHLK